MKVAVLSLTRDRLDYTKRAFASLRMNAGCAYDHYVLDNGSEDGTPEWLDAELADGMLHYVLKMDANMGVHPALNVLLRLAWDANPPYDAVFNFDNDCEVLVPATLRVAADFNMRRPGTVVGPHTHGLRSPPVVHGEVTVDGLRIGATVQIGGIFMPLPRGWLYDETAPAWGNGDGQVCHQANRDGQLVGYLLDFPVNHMDTTDGQHARYPEYFARRVREGGPA